MTVELRPLGVRCNIRCEYCYQQPQRAAGNSTRKYNMAAMKAAILAEGGPFALFGGEALLLPKADLEELFAWGFSQFGQNAVQTNGTLIDGDHIRLFRQYNVRVGISIDGPDQLNNVRWAGSQARTQRTTQATEAAIHQLCKAGVIPALIITLHRGNATAEHLKTLVQWVTDLASLGISSVRLHLLEVENEDIRKKLALTDRENISALLAFAELQKQSPQISFDVFADVMRLLLGRDCDERYSTSCVWNACDPYTTPAVRGVEGNGQRTNCGRTNKDGVDFVKSKEAGFERYMALAYTPQEYGGCNGCRFFIMCKGQCPGTAINGDWRNRTEHCLVWKSVFEWMEAELLAGGRRPLSLDPARHSMEALMIEGWRSGRNITLVEAAAMLS